MNTITIIDRQSLAAGYRHAVECCSEPTTAPEMVGVYFEVARILAADMTAEEIAAASCRSEPDAIRPSLTVVPRADELPTGCDTCGGSIARYHDRTDGSQGGHCNQHAPGRDPSSAWLRLVGLCGTNFHAVVRRAGKSVYVAEPMQNSGEKVREWRISAEKFDAGATQIRDCYAISMWCESSARTCAAESNWQD